MAYFYEYSRPAVTVDCIIINHFYNPPKLLLIQRGKPPFKGCWALPGGFMDIKETLAEAAARELEEETGLKGIDLKQVGIFDALERDPRHRTISVIYYGEINNNNINLKAQDDAANLEWHSVNALPDLAFDHQNIISTLLFKEIKK